ncbi:MAG: hypothetical protein SchgKO_25240 [Schleiferiaceae bacterium]
MSRFDKDFSKAYGKKRFSESEAQSGWERLGPELDAEFPVKGSGGGRMGQSTLLAVAIGLTMSIISIGSQVQSTPYFEGEGGALSTSISQTEVSQTNVNQTNINQSNQSQTEEKQTTPSQSTVSKNQNSHTSSTRKEGKSLDTPQEKSDSKSLESKNNNTTLESEKTLNSQESNIEETIPAMGSTAGVLASNPPAVGLSEEPEARTLAMENSKNKESAENPSLEEVERESKEAAKETTEETSNNEESAEELMEESMEDPIKDPVEDATDNPIVDPNNTAEENSPVLVQKPSNANRSKFYVGVQGAGLSQNRNLSGATNLWVSERNAKETVNPALSLGLTLGWAWNENWSVQLGVNHLQWTEDMKYPLSEETDTALHDSRWGRPEDFYNDIIHIDSVRVVDSIYVGHYVYNLTYRTIDTNDAPLNRTQQFTYVQLPISVEYTYPLGAWRPYASGGVVLGFPSQKSAVYRGVYETVPLGYSFSNIQYSVAGQIGIGYAIDSHWSLRAFGTYSQNLNSTFSTSQFSQTYARWGGGFGVRFTW